VITMGVDCDPGAAEGEYAGGIEKSPVGCSFWFGWLDRNLW